MRRGARPGNPPRSFDPAPAARRGDRGARKMRTVVKIRTVLGGIAPGRLAGITATHGETMPGRNRARYTRHLAARHILPRRIRVAICARFNRRLVMPSPTAKTVNDVLRHAEAAFDQSRDNLFALLRIPSISAQPAHQQDCRRAAEWWREQLTGLGFRADIRPTAGHPVVVGHYDGPAGLQRPARAVLCALRRAAGRSAGAMEQPAVRAAACGWTARQAVRRARRGGRQGPVGDVPRSVARLAHRRRRHPRAPHRADRGRGGSRQRQPGTLRRRA